MPHHDADAAAIIDALGLEPLTLEGGMIGRVWRTEAGSAIYYLVRPGDFSAFHRLGADELWHHYLGAPVQMVLLRPDGGVRRPVLGTDLGAGERPLVVVEAETWIGAETQGEWSLVGATMAPAFDLDGFEMGDREWLSEAYPEAVGDIRRLTREET